MIGKNLELLISSKCNMSCYFCDSRNIEQQSTKNLLSILTIAYKKWCTILTLTWWEPTLNKDLFLIIKFAKKIWYKKITLQSNLILANSVDFFLSLYKSWVTNIWFPFFWNDKSSFNIITKSEKYADYKENLDILFSLKLFDIRADIMLIPESINYIKEYSEILINKWVNEIFYINPFSWVNIELKNNVYNYSNILKTYLLKSSFKNFRILGWPTCYFKWLEEHVYEYTDNDILFEWKFIWLNEVKNNHFSKISKCDKCIYIDSCFWFDKKILNENLLVFPEY